MSVALRTKSKGRKLPSVSEKGLSWVGEEGVTITDTRIKPDLDRFARLPPRVLTQLKEVESDHTIIPGQKFTDIPATNRDNDANHDKTTAKGRSVSIQLQRDTFRRIAGIREFADVTNSYLIRKVDIRKNPEKSLGFYICEGDGWDRQDGIFVSRLVLGSYIEANNFLRVGDEILKVNEVYVKDFSLNDVALMMQVVEKLVLTVKILTSVSHMRRHSTRLSVSSNTFSARAMPVAQFESSSITENVITLTTPIQQATTHKLAEKVDTETFEVADPQVAQNNDEEPSTELKKSLSDTSMVLSVSQVLNEGYEILDSSTLTVDVHDSMTQDVNNKHASQEYEMDVSPTAVVIDVSKNTTHPDQKANYITLPEKSDGDEQGSDSDDNEYSDDAEYSDDNEDDTDFSILRKFKKWRKAKKKIPATSDTYEVKKSFWQMQEESIAMQDKIDPIRDMEDTSTTFTGKKANEFLDIKTKELEGVDNHTSSTSPDHNKSSTDPQEVTVMIKVKHLSDISSFTPQNLYCCILVDSDKKASTNVKAIQGTTADFNEYFYIDLLSASSELQIMICKPAEVDTGAVEHILSTGTVKLPGINRKPEEISLAIGSTGILTMDIQVLPLEY